VGDLEWEVERIVKSEMISYTRKVRGRNKPMNDLQSFVKWKGCAENETTGEPPDDMKNAQDEVERFNRERSGDAEPGRGGVT